MGPELMVAIVGPIIGGAVSVLVWANKKNYDVMNNGFRSLNGTVNIIERKLDDLRFDVAKNYVTNDELTAHIKGEEEWHVKFSEDITSIKEDIRSLQTKND